VPFQLKCNNIFLSIKRHQKFTTMQNYSEEEKSSVTSKNDSTRTDHQRKENTAFKSDQDCQNEENLSRLAYGMNQMSLGNVSHTNKIDTDQIAS